MCCQGGGANSQSEAADKLYTILGDISQEQWNDYQLTGKPLTTSMQLGVMDPGTLSNQQLRQMYRDEYRIDDAQGKKNKGGGIDYTDNGLGSASTESVNGEMPNYLRSAENYAGAMGHVHDQAASMFQNDWKRAQEEWLAENGGTSGGGKSGGKSGGRGGLRKGAPSFQDWKKEKKSQMGSLLVDPNYKGVSRRAGATVAQAFNAERENLDRGMAAMGVDPRSGRYSAARRQLGMAKAASEAGAMNFARTNERRYADETNFNRKAAVAGFGQAQASSASSGLSGAASGLAGLGTARMNADAQQSAGIGQLVGSGLGAYASYLAFTSDRRLKENIEAVGVNAENGLTVYEFNYVGEGPDVRYRGVMADEVQQKFPEAVLTDGDGYMRVNYGQIGMNMVRV